MKAAPGMWYSLLIFGLICFFTFSDEPKFEEDRKLHRRQLMEGRPNGRTAVGMKHEPIVFDPLVAEVERRREDRQWEKEHWTNQYKTWANQAQHWISNPHLGQHAPPKQMYEGTSMPPAMEAEPQPGPWGDLNNTDDGLFDDYTGEDYMHLDHFNVTRRLEILFPQIDTSPRDGFIDVTELEHWHYLSALRNTKHRTEREIQLHDLNGDGMITFREYLPHLKQTEIEENQMAIGGAGWWRVQFDNADADGNGILNRTELHEFLHPEDSEVEAIHNWLVKEEVQLRSSVRAPNLTWHDFHENVFDVIRDYGAEESASELAHLNPYKDMEARKQILSKAKFNALDVNGDGFITPDEAEPFVNKLRPGELYYARQQAQELITQADNDKDGRLTLEEMTTNPYAFYTTAYDHDNDATAHDEFR